MDCVPPWGVTVAEEQELIWTVAVPDVTVLPQLSIGGWGLDSDSVKLPPPLSGPVICQVTVPHSGLVLVSVPVTEPPLSDSANVLPELSVHVPLMSLQFVVELETGGGGVGTGATSGGGWSVGGLVSGCV